jgi:preprotein translocase subunit SecA
MSELSLKPGLSLGGYPQRPEQGLGDLEAAIRRGAGRLLNPARRVARPQVVARRIRRLEKELRNLGDAELDAAIDELRALLHRRGLRKALIVRAFALVCEAADRTLGKRHFDSQLYGGWLMIHGLLAEMQTGEGKTLTATLPACTAALAGIPVHVITANDYLAGRDCELMTPLYRRLGLSGSAVVDGMPLEQCQQAYQADIVHTTNKQIAFDYLRDRIEMGEDTGDLRFQFRQIKTRLDADAGSRLLLRGLCFAIVDEADSVLIDEANTPLIITRKLPNEDSPETYSDALYLASLLRPERDFRADARRRTVELTVSGEDCLEEQVQNLPRLWNNPRKRLALVRQALTAILFYHRDRDYLVEDGQVQIIDQSTGRRMPDRAWEQGLQQMIEAKEGCLISEHREPQARISYQRFFSRYLRLGGTSGTLGEVSAELRRVYGLEVRRVAPNMPCRRIHYGIRVFRDSEAQKDALIERVTRIHGVGRPILIGTCSVEDSERVSGWLREAEFEHRVLNARQDREEAEIVAAAGQRDAITVATNMAGRGTDIALGNVVEALGGLHVIATGLNPSRRLDRQLFGRCARQGDPGSAEAILSLRDEALIACAGGLITGILRLFAGNRNAVPALIARPLLRLAQRRHETRQRRIRKALIRQDRRLRRTLAFSGRFE